jgi:hypothetical protein
MAERRLRSRLHKESAMIGPGDQAKALKCRRGAANFLRLASNPQTEFEV